jgi:hypothetical protein
MTDTSKTKRWNMRVEPEWSERIRAQAQRLGISGAAYVTMAVRERLEKDEATAATATRPAMKGKGKRRGKA